MGKQVTIKQIAAEAGVSVATVSRIFNGKDEKRVGAELREHVRRIIDKYNYHPNASAKNLVCGKSCLIGIQIKNLKSPAMNVDMIDGIEKAAGEKGYNIILGITGQSTERESRSIRTMLAKGVDGIIWQPETPVSEDILEAIEQAGCPLVWLNRQVENSPHPYVTGDHYKAGALCTEYLIKLGHREIAFVGSAEDTHTVLRRQGYESVIEANGLNRHFFEAYDLTCDLGREKLLEILEHHPEITAISATSDILVSGMSQLLLEKGIPPKKFALTSYGNRIFTAYLNPPVTSVAINYEKMGETAFATLDKLLNGQQPDNTLIGPGLVIRKSCGE